VSWREVSIGELGRIVTGKTPPTGNREFYDGEYPFVTPTDLDWQSYIVRSTHSSVTELARDRNKNQFIPANSTVFTCIGNTIGKCGLSAVDCLTNQQINSVVPADEHDPKFVYYLLNYHRPQIRSLGLGNGAAQPIINKTTFSGVKVSVPATRDDEQRIAAILSAYDDLIENNRRRIALLEDVARQLYKEWFVRFRFPGHEHVKIIDGLPEGWEPMALADYVEIVKDTADPKSLDPDTPYIGLEHLPRRSITLSEWETAEKVESGKFRFQEKDIIFGKIRPYFHKVGFTLLNGITSSDAIIMRPKNAAWWACVLMEVSSDRFVALASQTVKEGSKMPRANWDVLKKHVLALPPEGLRQTFNEQIEAIAVQTKTLSLAIAQAAKARDLLLPKLMSGAIAV
jgi:type I restriction enzyme, S subunit